MPIEKTVAYKASDGERFETLAAAEQHEVYLNIWQLLIDGGVTPDTATEVSSILAQQLTKLRLIINPGVI